LPVEERGRVKIIVGLGNPGREYERTRHNIGFQVTDAFVGELSGVSQKSRFRAVVREGVSGTTKYVVAQPQMYMNLSGVPVREIVNWYKADLDDLLVIYDDMDLPFGQLRMRADGSAGGHNGMKSIIGELGTTEFARLRVGIGRGGGSSTAHVLSRFRPEESATIEQTIDEAVRAIFHWSERGVIDARNVVNRPVTEAEPGPGDG
jgi:PTH1 family peptidyl-tRNA hydrolase